MVFENTHEAIWTEEMANEAKRARESRRLAAGDHTDMTGVHLALGAGTQHQRTIFVVANGGYDGWNEPRELLHEIEHQIDAVSGRIPDIQIFVYVNAGKADCCKFHVFISFLSQAWALRTAAAARSQRKPNPFPRADGRCDSAQVMWLEI